MMDGGNRETLELAQVNLRTPTPPHPTPFPIKLSKDWKVRWRWLCRLSLVTKLDNLVSQPLPRS